MGSTKQHSMAAITPDRTVLLDLSITGDGRVSGRTASSPDRAVTFGQVRLARFQNPSGLQRGNANTYRGTQASGPPMLGDPGAGFGTIYQMFLERSNVEKSTELFELQTTRDLYEATKRILLGA